MSERKPEWHAGQEHAQRERGPRVVVVSAERWAEVQAERDEARKKVRRATATLMYIESRTHCSGNEAADRLIDIRFTALGAVNALD